MTSEQADRTMMGWSREWLAQASNVEVASVYLLERTGTAGPEDDARIRTTLVRGKAKYARSNAHLAANDFGYPQNGQQANDTGLGQVITKQSVTED